MRAANKSAYMKDSKLMSKAIDDNAELAKLAQTSRESASVNKTFAGITSTVGHMARELSRAVAADPSTIMGCIKKDYVGGRTGVDWARVGIESSMFFRELPMPSVVYFMCVHTSLCMPREAPLPCPGIPACTPTPFTSPSHCPTAHGTFPFRAGLGRSKALKAK